MSGGHASVRLYLVVGVGLGVFTVVTVLASYLHLPMHWAVPLALAIASVKAGLVAAYFMHLKGERALIYAFLALTVAFVAVLVALPLLDTVHHEYAMAGSVPEVRPVRSAHEAASGGGAAHGSEAAPAHAP